MKVWTISKKFQKKLDKISERKSESLKKRKDYFKNLIGKEPKWVMGFGAECVYKKCPDIPEGLKASEYYSHETGDAFKVEPDRRTKLGKQYYKELTEIPQYSRIFADSVILDGALANYGMSTETINGTTYIVGAVGKEFIKQLKKDGCKEIEL